MAKQPPPRLEIHPPLVNSSNPWASTLEDLRSLYACPSTGAVTTRTSLIHGFPHDDAKHQYIFLDPATHTVSRESPCPGPQTSTLNSLGYSPFPLETYLDWIKTISSEQQNLNHIKTKGFIISVTGTPAEISLSYQLISQAQSTLPPSIPLAMEINLSCPNIPNKPPPAYSKSSLLEYLSSLNNLLSSNNNNNSLPRIPIGLKTPPYTYATQFKDLISALVDSCEEDDE